MYPSNESNRPLMLIRAYCFQITLIGVTVQCIYPHVYKVNTGASINVSDHVHRLSFIVQLLIHYTKTLPQHTL